jgi:heme exporter protein A
MTSAKSMVPLLEARAVSFLRQDEAVFAPLDFQVHAGELVLVEGANGSGKTTLLRMLAGLLHVGSGELRWRGTALQHGHGNGEILFLGHQLGIKAELTPRENLDVAVGLHGQREGASAAAAMLQVGLGGYEDEPTRRLSAGQKKRAALARLLLLPATLWLLDEPYANLDHAGTELVNQVLQWHAQGGGAALVSSHQTAHFAAAPAQRIHLHA